MVDRIPPGISEADRAAVTQNLRGQGVPVNDPAGEHWQELASGDRKSTRLNSSHVAISYAVFCLKKKKNKVQDRQGHGARTGGRKTRRTPRSPCRRDIRHSAR